MNVKTNLKAGENVKQFINDSGRFIKRVGQEAGQAVQDVAQTVTSRKFWTWPW